MDPSFPLTWHLQKQFAGSGPHGDLNSHSVDLARYLVGDIKKVTGMTAQLHHGAAAARRGDIGHLQRRVEGQEMGKVTVEDAAFMIVEFANGALGSFEATRFAPGRKNYNYFEIYGSKGSLAFDLERMNELKFFSQDDPANAQGFRTILATEGGPARLHRQLVAARARHRLRARVRARGRRLRATPWRTRKKIEPNFYDGMKELEVLDAGLRSAETGKAVELA